jgi:hypothetical protein
MACHTHVDVQRGKIGVSGDNADEVHAVILSMVDHLRAFAHDLPYSPKLNWRSTQTTSANLLWHSRSSVAMQLNGTGNWRVSNGGRN